MTEEIDWNSEWDNYLKDRIFWAVNCDKCKTTAGICDCAKTLWILKEKHKRGIPVEAPFTCYECNSGHFDDGLTYSKKAGTHVSLCEVCEKQYRF